jgi:hypothetical protein
MNRAVDTAAAAHPIVCSVDDGVRGNSRDVAEDHVNGRHGTILSGRSYSFCVGSDLTAQRQRRRRERLGLLPPQPSRLAGGLDRGLLDVRDGTFELVGVLRTYCDEAQCPGTARSATSAGRSLIITMSLIRSRR